MAPSDSELERVKVQYEAGLVRGIERIGGFGGKSDRLAQGGNVCRQSRSLQSVAGTAVRQATKSDLQNVAREVAVGWMYTFSNVHPFPELQDCHVVCGPLEAARYGGPTAISSCRNSSAPRSRTA